MKINITYPKPKIKLIIRQNIINIMKWPFIASSFICFLINIIVGGKAWSIVVAWSLYIVWTLFICPALVEFNRLSLFIKIIINTSILLALVDFIVTPGWSVEAISILCFSGLIVCSILFFTDIKKQKYNMFPMILFIFLSVIFSIIGLIIWKDEIIWPLIVMMSISVSLFICCFWALKLDFILELKKIFHTK